jgi:peptide/nickel transport system ATP-binding protein/oligopeptide transport system ATP-binding protein
MKSERILEIKNLSTHFRTEEGTIQAVNDVDLFVHGGETLGIVGESGCGKTVLALSVMRLVPSPPGKIVSGTILYAGRDLLSLTEQEMQGIRGNEISMIFQEPMTSLNPVFQVGEQIAEAIRLHQGLSSGEARDRSVEALRLVGMPSPESSINQYPHQMSGGMRQRVMIAMAMCCNPNLILADEPTTALDVTIQAQILDLIGRLKEQSGTAVVLITHDLGVIADAAQNVAVMYAGRVVEYGEVSRLFSTPLHPYTMGLLESTPRLKDRSMRDGYLKTIPGNVPDLHHLPKGCSFQDRCPHVMEQCRNQEPEWIEKSTARYVRCWLNS